ncbi:MAG: DUF1146 domain-containing protein [Bacilli bacterium]|nr:DUF1146 domain-containing protein [Bacilli bacterium]
MYNLLLYSIVFAVIVWVMDGININFIFKKNKVYQARMFYIIIIISLTYLVTNFMIDFLNCLQ